jgi:hypothetical protein
MDTAPVWLTPYHFTFLHRTQEGLIPMPAFTYQLVSMEIARVDLDGPNTTRLGFEGIAALISVPLPAALGGPEAYFRPKPIDPEALAAFVAIAKPRISGVLDDWHLRPLISELDHAADKKASPDPTKIEIEDIGDALDVAERMIEGRRTRLRPVRMLRGQRQVRGLVFDDLAQRIAVELHDLFWIRPKLVRCRFCNRVFVDKTGQTRDACRAYVWNAHTLEHIEFCSTRVDEHNARAKDTAKRRKAKALSAAISRAQKRAEATVQDHGANSSEAKAALRDVEARRAEFQAWRKLNPPERPGRPEKPIPTPEPDIVLTKPERGD